MFVSREAIKASLAMADETGNMKCEELRRIFTVIDNLPSVKPATVWHKVKEELPEENGVYLACHEDATVLLDWFNGKWFFHGKNPAVEETGTIIAWMPLPEPCKSESKKINCKTTKCENCINHNYCDFEPQERSDKE